MREVEQRRTALKRALSGTSIVVAPGVFDGVSARLADRMGFTALYMTGYGAVASSLGLPDAGIATFTEMSTRAGMIAGTPSAATSLPACARSRSKIRNSRKNAVTCSAAGSWRSRTWWRKSVSRAIPATTPTF